MLFKGHWKIIGKFLLLLVIVKIVWPFEGQASYITQFSDNLVKEGELSFTANQYLNQDDIAYLTEGNLSVFGAFSDNLDFRAAAKAVYQKDAMDMEDESRPYMTFDEEFQHPTQPYVDLKEAFVNWRNRSTQVKVGLQFIDWGQIDGMPITDLAKATDFRVFPSSSKFMSLEDTKVGLPAVSVMHRFSTWNVEAFYCPTWIPYRFPDIDESWFRNFTMEFQEITASPEVLQLPPMFSSIAPDGMTVPMTMHTRNPEPPEWFKDHQFGARIRKDIGYSMVGLLYFKGFDWLPTFEADTFLTLPRSLDINEMINQDMFLDAFLYPVKREIQMVGMEFSTTVKNAAIRGEAAYIKDRYYNKMLFDFENLPEDIVDTNLIMSDFLERYSQYPDADVINLSIPLEPSDLVKKTDELQVGLQMEYMYKGLMIVSMCMYNHLFSPDPDVDLIMREDDLMAMVAVAFPYLKQDMLITGGGGSYLVAGGVFGMAIVEKTWKDTVTTELGISSMSGPENSILGMMDSNDEIFFKISYSF